ncbi:MAG: PAS domain S-box protein, partial [Leptolyngbyaceae bacterium]|nr:PAS domain S-box protein [Leptolyngbyaceae bacterium]
QRPYQYLAIRIDITARKIAEDSLKASEARYRRMLDTAGEGVWVLDAASQTTYVNNRLAQMLRTEPEALLGKSLFDFMDLEEQELATMYLERRRSGVQEQHDFRFRRADGQPLWAIVETSPILDDQGNYVGSLGMLTDITERKAAEAALQLENQFREQIVEQMAEGLCVCQAIPTEPFVYFSVWNQQMQQITGYTQEEINRLGWHQMVYPDSLNRDRAIARMNRVQQGDNLLGEQWTIQRRDGENRTISVSTSLLSRYVQKERQESDSQYILAIVQDITERQRDRRTLEHRNTLLQTISQAQSQFITDGNRNTIFDGLLSGLLDLTHSEYGFIGEVLFAADGSANMEDSFLKIRGVPYLQAHSITNIAWNEETRQLYEEQQATGMKFTNMKTLFGAVIMTGEPVIANSPSTDSRRGGIPDGHPPLNAFLGIPFFSGSQLIGMVGIANRPGGYDVALMESLQPFLTTCSNLIEGYRLDRQKREAEAARQVAEQEIAKQLASIEAAVDGIAILDGDSYQYLNPAHVRMFGYETADELIGQSWRKLYSAEELQRFERDVFPGLLRDRAWQGEAIAIRKDGSTFVEGLSLTLTDDNLLICVCQDISERKQAEAQLYNLSTRLGLALQSGAIGTWEWDLLTKQLTWDQRMLDLYEMHPDDFTGQVSDWSERIHPDDRANTQTQLQRAIDGEQEYNTEFRIIHPNGQVRYLKANGLVQRNEQGEPERMIGINFDISDRKQAEADIIKALEHERELSEMKSRFVSNTSHEFRTPLAVISNNAELLKLFGDKLDDREKQECLDTILSYVDHTTELINEVLVVNKAESGTIQLNLQAIDVIEFSRKLCQEMSMNAPDHHFEFEVKDVRNLREKEEGAIAEFDSRLLQQILTNLLTNAHKYSPGDSTITFQLELLPTHVQFSVMDAGIGIPEADQKHLFEPFHRATNVGNTPGTGLGLSIVKHLVTIHQGHIKVNSQLGKGSCFTVKIPTQWQTT